MDPLQSAQIANTVNQEPPVPPQPPVVPQPVNPIEPPKQKNSSIIFILSLTTIVACLIAAFFYWQNTKLIKEATKIETPSPTPTPDITLNWKTYTNTSLGFSFKYPNEWTQNSPINLPNQKIKELLNLKTDIIAKGMSIDGFQDPPISFRVEYFDYITDLNIWIQEMRSSGETQARIIGTNTLNGYNFSEVFGLGSLGGCTKDYFIKTEQKGYLDFKAEPYSSDCTTDKSNSQVDEKIIQILSTFKFSDQAKIQECITQTTCKGTVPCMANPASVFCTCMGGKSSIKKAIDGSESGICTIDGKAQDEWEYFRSLNPAASTAAPTSSASASPTTTR